MRCVYGGSSCYCNAVQPLRKAEAESAPTNTLKLTQTVPKHPRAALFLASVGTSVVILLLISLLFIGHVRETHVCASLFLLYANLRSSPSSSHHPTSQTPTRDVLGGRHNISSNNPEPWEFSSGQLPSKCKQSAPHRTAPPAQPSSPFWFRAPCIMACHHKQSEQPATQS